jgi:hypothetical protein
MKTTNEKLLTINALSDATAIDRRTCRKRLSEAGMLAGRTKWSLAETLPLLAAGRPSKSLEAARLKLIHEQTRKTAAEANVAEAKNEILLKHWCPVEGVTRIWDNTLIILRNKVAESEMPQDLKIEILKDLKAAAAAEYFDDGAPIEQEGPMLPSTDEG